jgi:hypothetical protein
MSANETDQQGYGEEDRCCLERMAMGGTAKSASKTPRRHGSIRPPRHCGRVGLSPLPASAAGALANGS